MPLLEITRLTKTYARPGGGAAHRVVDVAEFTLAAGEQRALRGESGTGKTTFLHLIAGILAPDGGAIFFDAGRAWNGPDAVTAGQHVLTDMGFGMRITDSRSSMGSVLHLDLAFPLNARDQVRSVQFIIKSQSSF